MQIMIKFVAFSSCVPKAFTSIEVEDGCDVRGFLEKVWGIWKEELKGYDNSETFINTVMPASAHEMLMADDKLKENQEITIIGQIIGG